MTNRVAISRVVAGVSKTPSAQALDAVVQPIRTAMLGKAGSRTGFPIQPAVLSESNIVVLQLLEGSAANRGVSWMVLDAGVQQHQREKNPPALRPNYGIDIRTIVKQGALAGDAIRKWHPDGWKVSCPIARGNVAPIDIPRDFAVFRQHVSRMKIVECRSKGAYRSDAGC
jgi:hypothetical protein